MTASAALIVSSDDGEASVATCDCCDEMLSVAQALLCPTCLRDQAVSTIREFADRKYLLGRISRELFEALNHAADEMEGP